MVSPSVRVQSHGLLSIESVELFAGHCFQFFIRSGKNFTDLFRWSALFSFRPAECPMISHKLLGKIRKEGLAGRSVVKEHDQVTSQVMV